MSRVWCCRAKTSWARPPPTRRSPFTTAAAHAPGSLTALRERMLSRPSTEIFDNLSPVPSHLLTVVLSDHLPRSCWPRHFDAATARLPAARTAAPALPQGHHLVYFAPQLAGSQLLADGTDPAHSPGAPWARRMWAGGSLAFGAQWEGRLRLDGRRAVCVESVEDVKVKGGGRGAGATGAETMLTGDEKVFVDVVRRYGEVGGREKDALLDDDDDDAVVRTKQIPAIEEVRTLVFLRDQPLQAEARQDAADARVVKAPYKPTFSFTLRPSATLLFHYSALTFNAHAIHLDPEYCRRAEGHRNLLVHGPLTLTLMLSALRSQLGPAESIRRMDYRNHAPLYAGEDMTVCLRPSTAAGGLDRKWDVWVEGPRGGLAVKATATTRV